jgi:endonuclease/exonuclease/phosphatase (EEP) superfamily protein YafD
MELALIAVGVVMIVATVLPLFRSPAWWIRIFDFPRIQITIVSALTLVLYPVVREQPNVLENLFLTGLALSLAHQCYMMYPYTFLSPRQVQQSRQPRKDSSFGLVFANVFMNNRNAKRLREMIREADPDIILAVETDWWWQEQLRDFEQSHPYTVHQPQNNTYGMLLYSRLELLHPEIRFLVENDVPSIHAVARLPSGQEVELHCLHPRPPFPTEDDDALERDAELLIVGREVKGKKRPVIVLGDLNDVAWSRTNYLFQNISGLLDPRIGRGFCNTFHAKWPVIRYPLDHFFHSKHFRLISLKRLPYFGSDHFPVHIALSYEPEAAGEEEDLRATPSQQQEASEKIQKMS